MQIDIIELTEYEKSLVELIGISRTNVGAHNWSPQIGKAMCDLVNALLENGSIPSSRINYFVNPDYNNDRHKGSRKDNFIRNAGSEEAMMHHPHFLKYIQYFVFGSKLPLHLKQDFEMLVQSYGNVTSGDIPTLSQFSRRAASTSSLSKVELKEEIYKLALDCDLEEFIARQIRMAS